ncbi:MAG: HAD-IA family hydrolase, partial [Gammaproteobacteria bacterium]|nr:HAD-IA family hydrolase [Gammaproteobacteria bacterium]NIO62408.1 HAD-IA family hydrolase [Gammaproteobacteria bacterium]
INEAKNKEILLAIATSSSSKNVATLLESNLGKQALSLFETIVTCDIVEDKKPSPAVYQYALAQMGLEAQDCIAIEDTYNGNLSALNTGIKTVITIHDFTVQDDFTGASLVIDNLGEPGQAFTVIDGNDFG